MIQFGDAEIGVWPSSRTLIINFISVVRDKHQSQNVLVQIFIVENAEYAILQKSMLYIHIHLASNLTWFEGSLPGQLDEAETPKRTSRSQCRD